MKLSTIKARLKAWINYNLSFLGVLFSPLAPLKTVWYFGEIKHGTPYFLPRRWVNCDIKDGVEAWNKLHEQSQKAYLARYSKDCWVENYAKTHRKPVSIKYFGFDFVSLGWKTKWNEYRFEWNPSISIVLFGRQLFISIIPDISLDHHDSYWEAWLNYDNKTDKSLSRKERTLQLFERYSCTWTGTNGKLDHYEFILRGEYLLMYREWMNKTPRAKTIEIKN